MINIKESPLVTKITNLLILNIKNNTDAYNYFTFPCKTRKFNIFEIIKYIIFVIQTGVQWRLVNCHISWNTIYKTYKKLLKMNIIKKTFIELVKKYLKKTPARKLKSIITDTTFISNKYGSESVAYNGHKKRKGTKVSLITDIKGIPIDVRIGEGNKYDSVIFLNTLNDINECNFNYDIYGKYIKNVLADTGYDSSKIRNQLEALNIHPIIKYNKRNTKNDKKIKKLTKKEEEKYIERINIEHTNAHIKNVRRVNVRYDRIIDTFLGSVYVACICKIITSVNDL